MLLGALDEYLFVAVASHHKPHACYPGIETEETGVLKAQLLTRWDPP